LREPMFHVKHRAGRQVPQVAAFLREVRAGLRGSLRGPDRRDRGRHGAVRLH